VFSNHLRPAEDNYGAGVIMVVPRAIVAIGPEGRAWLGKGWCLPKMERDDYDPRGEPKQPLDFGLSSKNSAS